MGIRRQQKFDRYRKWREMWEEGFTIREMAAKLDLKENSVGVRIVVLRRRHPDWFPKRRINLPKDVPREKQPVV